MPILRIARDRSLDSGQLWAHVNSAAVHLQERAADVQGLSNLGRALQRIAAGIASDLEHIANEHGDDAQLVVSSRTVEVFDSAAELRASELTFTRFSNVLDQQSASLFAEYAKIKVLMTQFPASWFPLRMRVEWSEKYAIDALQKVRQVLSDLEADVERAEVRVREALSALSVDEPVMLLSEVSRVRALL